MPLSKLRIGYIKTEFERAGPATDAARRRGGEVMRGRGRGEATRRARTRRPVAGRAAAAREERLKLLNDALDVYRKAGATLQPIELPETLTSIASSHRLRAEHRGGRRVRRPDAQHRTSTTRASNTWPNTFRTHRFVPAVEYIRAQRARTLLIREMDKLMSQYDVFLSPTNSAQPRPHEPDRPSGGGRARRIRRQRAVELMVTGRLYDEATLLRVALAYERATKWNDETQR